LVNPASLINPIMCDGPCHYHIVFYFMCAKFAVTSLLIGSAWNLRAWMGIFYTYPFAWTTKNFQLVCIKLVTCFLEMPVNSINALGSFASAKFGGPSWMSGRHLGISVRGRDCSDYRLDRMKRSGLLGLPTWPYE
jgi:hypothetical protein